VAASDVWKAVQDSAYRFMLQCVDSADAKHDHERRLPQSPVSSSKLSTTSSDIDSRTGFRQIWDFICGFLTAYQTQADSQVSTIETRVRCKVG